VKVNSPTVVTCMGLTKIYQSGVVALNDLTLTIEPGMSFGLMGENGAGKSTLVKLLMGSIFPTKGQLSVLGETEVRRAHSRIGYLHERPNVELRFTARSYLTYMAQLSGYWNIQAKQRVQSTLEQVDLYAASDERLATYSKGMLQRLSIAQTLLTDPQLLILDEPTNGLDPYSQWQVRQIIAALRKQGKTILICSHYLAEVEMLCDTVGILHHGELVQSGAVSDLVHTQNAIEIVLRDEYIASDIITQLFFAALFFPFQEGVPYFYGTSNWDLSAIAVLGAAIMVRQAISPRTYVLLARLSSRASYSRGLMLAATTLRIPIFLFILLLVLLTHRLINPSVDTMFIGALGVLTTTILVSVLTVALSSPIATRLLRILFLSWIAVVLFSISPIFTNPSSVLNILAIVRIPLWPISACYQVSVAGTIGLTGVLGTLLVAVYIVGLALVAGMWLERRELLLY